MWCVLLQGSHCWIQLFINLCIFHLVCVCVCTRVVLKACIAKEYWISSPSWSVWGEGEDCVCWSGTLGRTAKVLTCQLMARQGMYACQCGAVDGVGWVLQEGMAARVELRADTLVNEPVIGQ